MMRTSNQNRALHKYIKALADESLNKGLTIKAIVNTLNVSISPEFIKDCIRAIGKAKYQKDKTSDMTTIELSDCIKETSKIFSEQGAYIPFPSVEELEFTKYYDKK